MGLITMVFRHVWDGASHSPATNQKKLDELRKTRVTKDCRDSPLIEDKKELALRCANALEVIGEEKLQETINFIVFKGNDPLLAMKATS